MDKAVFEYLSEEIKNSLGHIQHLEVQRSRYAAFYFTLVVGTIGVLVSSLKDINIEDISEIVFAFLVSIFILNSVIGSLLLSGLKKIRYAISLHDEVLDSIRDKLLEGENFSHSDLRGKYGKKNPIHASKVINNQLAIENIFTILSLIFSLFGIYVSLEGYHENVIGDYYFFSFLILISFSIMYLFLVLYYSSGEPK